MVNITQLRNSIESAKILLDKLYKSILDEYGSMTEERVILCKIEKNIQEIRNELIDDKITNKS